MKRSICTLLSAWLLSGCGDTPSDQQPSDAAGQREDAEVEESALIQVPRNRTLIMDCAESGTCAGQIKDYNTFNPYRPESTSRTGYNFVFEPLYFYNAFEGKLIPWIATDHRFNDAYTEVEIAIRPGVKWSDGMPWTAHDLVFTINMLKDNAPLLSYSTDMKNWVQEAVAVDSLTARIALTAPNPRFVFSYFTHNFGNGVPIVPKHVWEGQSPDTFENFDPQKGWPVFSGPYKLVLSTPQQRIWDLRPDWWAAATGFQSLPKVERIIYLPYMEEAKRVQNLITNHIDTSLDLRPPNILTVLDKNSRVTTWTGREPPYGYVDFWPISLGFNNLEAPFADVDVRRAINYAINRQQLVEVGWQGAGIFTLLPLPDYPALRPYFSEVEDLLEEYEIGVFDLDKSAALMRSMGWQRSADSYWTKDGEPLEMLIDIYPIFQDITPVLVAPARASGFRRRLPQYPRHVHPHIARHGTLLYHRARRRRARSVFYAAALSQPLRAANRPARRVRLALAERGIRPDRRSDGGSLAARSAAGAIVSPSHGNLAGRTAVDSALAVVSPHSAQSNLLAQLAFGIQPVHQQRLLAPGVVASVAQFTAGTGIGLNGVVFLGILVNGMTLMTSVSTSNWWCGGR